MSFLKNFLELFYPRLCFSCEKSLLDHENVLCTLCQYQLPQTNYHLQAENPLTEALWGRVRVQHVSAMYYFHKGNKVQHLIHQLKYKGEKEIGVYLGKIYGRELIKSEFYQKIDIIVPVPLHPKKQKKRGYNQSEMLANGLSETMKIPVDKITLIKINVSESQTKKNRFKRWENVKEIFTIKNYDHLKYKHILLVDDVFTTGATCDACTTQLLKIPGVTVSIVTLACTVR
jgi:ComF family protein